MILCLETATSLCSVALCDAARIISLKESDELKSHASMLTVFADEILRENGITASNLDAVAVSKGPGSYTGLRIGVSAAKGIAYGASIPVIAIETTLSMFYGVTQGNYINVADEKDSLFCPMLDARRMEVYYALYDSDGNKVKEIAAEVINKDSFSSIPLSKKIIFFGDGAEKCRNVISRDNMVFIPGFRMSASYMLKPANKALNEKHFEDVAYFEPLYLKDFITTQPKKNILGK